MKTVLLAVSMAALATGCAPQSTARETSSSSADSTTDVLHIRDVEWEQLNPARGDRSPKAATLWGDRQGTGPTGFLVQFVDGFSSPPHIHNVSYRGVVVSGLVHNDDPDAARMWMPPGSFWTQPKGEVHITAARGPVNVAYIEIEEGPYLVLPIEEAFDSGERPVNMDASNIVWLDASNSTWIDVSGTQDDPHVAFLWGSPRHDALNGSLVRLPAGFSGAIHSHGASFRAVVIQGRPRLEGPREAGAQVLAPGSYLSANGGAEHRLACAAGEECIVYVRTEGPLEIRAD